MAKVDLDSRDDGVRLLTLTDPDRRNAIDTQLRDELAAAVTALAADDAARVLVVAGAGVAFCGGADLADLFGPPGRPQHVLRSDLVRVYDSFLSIRALSIPSIAVVQGAAVGAGVNLAMACDMRMFGPAGYLDVSFAALGIHPGGGATWFLTHALGPGRAIELILRGGRVTAELALEYGLANSVTDDPVHAALGLAGQISQLDPSLAASMRATVHQAVRAGLTEIVDAEARAQAASLLRNPAVLTPRRRSRNPLAAVAATPPDES